LRRCVTRDVFLLEARAVFAASGLHSAFAQTPRDPGAAGNRLPPDAVLFTRVG